jgi:amino acid adenylation domain-containing protein
LSGDSLLHGALEVWARRAPDSCAVTLGGQSLSYDELERRSRALGLVLRQHGLDAGDRVALLMPKSLDAVVAAYSVLRAGGTYVPIDEQSPPARQLRVMADSGARGIVGERRTLGALAEVDPIFPAGFSFVLARDPPPIGWPLESWDFGDHGTNGELPRVDAEQPAYLLYTSGSTGEPKGVTVTHRGARAFVDWAVRIFRLGPRDRLANHAQLSFDLSVLDLFASSVAGARVTLIPPELMLRPRLVWQLLSEQAVTTWYSVPSAIALLVSELRSDVEPPASLERVLFAGEVFPLPALRAAMQALPGARFFNLFGPTETNVCLWHELEAVPPPDATAIPIGIPCDHLEVELLDDQGAVVPEEKDGEIAVAGPSVLTGYWGRPELTRQAFWPAGTLRGVGPLYRTGDRARRDAEGRFWFLGRRDRLVKRRGYRVELGEVEAALAKHEAVRESAVVALPHAEAGFKIRAFVVPRPGAKLDVLQVKLHLSSLLPRYMMPDEVDFRTELPRTSTGKVDWQALA